MVKNLRKVRKGAGLSQRQLGDLVDMSEQVIGYWERGDRMPSSDRVIALAKALGVTSDYLLGLSDSNSIIYPGFPQGLRNAALSLRKRELLDMFYKFLQENSI